MATVTWPMIRNRILPAAPAHEEGMRRVALRLATQTVVLLLVMLIALEVVVYAITQQAYLGSLQDTLINRASQSDPTVCGILHAACGPQGPGPNHRQGQPQPGPGGGAFPPSGSSGQGANADLTASDASIVYVDSKVHVIHGDGALGLTMLDPHDAAQAVHTRQAQCCSVQKYQGQNYLVYSEPLFTNGKVVGAAQTSISEYQFEGTMRRLLEALLVVALLGLITSGGISVVLVRRALQPIRTAMQRQRDFVADAAHELRTPLAIMRTVGELGIADESGDDQQATIEQMLAENRHLTRLVDDLSLLARADSHTLAIDHRPTNLSSLVAETATELGPLAEEREVALTSEVQKNIWVLGDIVRLRQLLLILLDNALKHTPAGGTVSVRLSHHAGRARLQTTDSGPGIDPADLPRIFDRFYRADRARTGEGSGLGLAIGKWIVEAHGGSIHAGNASHPVDIRNPASAGRRGAVFTVTLPLARAAIRPAPAQE